MVALTIQDQPGGCSLVPIDGGAPWAALADRNPLGEAAHKPGTIPPAPRLIHWSGTPADGLFERDPRAWQADALARFERWCESAAPAGTRILIRPHARHVISDVPRISRFLSRFGGRGFGIVLDAASMIDASMLRDAADHGARLFESLGPIADAVWLTGIAPPPSDPDAPPAACPLGEGIIPAERIVSLWKRCCPPETPVVLLGPNPPGQLELIARPR